MHAPLKSSFTSPYGPSVTTGGSAEKSTTTPSSASVSPSPATSTPALIIDSLYRPIASRMSSKGTSRERSIASWVFRMISMYLVIAVLLRPWGRSPDPLTDTSNGKAGDRHRR